MEKDMGIICADGLSLFSTTNRLISHELKNILAIISETLGLIDELIELNDAGMKLEPGKFRSLSKSMIEEVDRANSIIRNMNTFAHSVDEFIGEVDINQLIILIIKISQLNPSSRNKDIHFENTEHNTLYTSPFFLGAFIYHAIDFALSSTGSNREIGISTHADTNNSEIILSGLDEIKGKFPTNNEETIAKALSAEVMLNVSSGELHIHLPKKIEKSLLGNLLP